MDALFSAEEEAPPVDNTVSQQTSGTGEELRATMQDSEAPMDKSIESIGLELEGILSANGSIVEDINADDYKRICVFLGWNHGGSDVEFELKSTDFRMTSMRHQNQLVALQMQIAKLVGMDRLHYFPEPLHEDAEESRNQISKFMKPMTSEEMLLDLAASPQQSFQLCSKLREQGHEDIFQEMFRADNRFMRMILSTGLPMDNIHGITSDRRLEEGDRLDEYVQQIYAARRADLIEDARLQRDITMHKIMHETIVSRLTEDATEGSVSVILLGFGHSRSAKRLVHNPNYVAKTTKDCSLEQYIESSNSLSDMRFITFEPSSLKEHQDVVKRDYHIL